MHSGEGPDSVFRMFGQPQKITEGELLALLLRILQEVKHDPSLKLGECADLMVELGLDSLELTELVLRIEDELSVQLNFSQLEARHFSSLEALAEFLRRQL